MLGSSSVVSFIRDEREYAMTYVCCYERNVTNTFHLPELPTYVFIPQDHIALLGHTNHLARNVTNQQALLVRLIFSENQNSNIKNLT